MREESGAHTHLQEPLARGPISQDSPESDAKLFIQKYLLKINGHSQDMGIVVFLSSQMLLG